MLPFGASSETWATTYCGNRLPASKALLGEPLEQGRLAPAPGRVKASLSRTFFE